MNTPRRVVTLPPLGQADAAARFARAARDAGADLLEVRNDLWEDTLDLRPLAHVLPLLVSSRGRPLARAFCEAAALADVELGSDPAPGTAPLCSLHAPAPLTPAQAQALWHAARVPAIAQVKHVEPLGAPADGARLFETQRALGALFGAARVTVLATGECALPFRALLAGGNALDYLALDARFVAAPGQRLLADAVRADRAKERVPRLGILGTGIGGSRSPRIHPPPFDRIDLPEGADVGALVEALTPWYRGFAVTRPFKLKVAAWLGRGDAAVNTLYRHGSRWLGANTDVEGARAVLDALGARTVTLLGDGGVGPALRAAASEQGRRVHVLRRADAPGAQVGGAAVWTWPPELVPPDFGLSGAKVAVISYGAAGRQVAEQIRARGGVPVPLGARWFIRQARAQRALWEGSTT
jgi:hypothetical protein